MLLSSDETVQRNQLESSEEPNLMPINKTDRAVRFHLITELIFEMLWVSKLTEERKISIKNMHQFNDTRSDIIHYPGKATPFRCHFDVATSPPIPHTRDATHFLYLHFSLFCQITEFFLAPDLRNTLQNIYEKEQVCKTELSFDNVLKINKDEHKKILKEYK
jgi:hypothetical protein